LDLELRAIASNKLRRIYEPGLHQLSQFDLLLADDKLDRVSWRLLSETRREIIRIGYLTETHTSLGCKRLMATRTPSKRVKPTQRHDGDDPYLPMGFFPHFEHL